VFARCVRLVDVHHHGPLKVRHGVGYRVQTLERLTSPGSGRLSPSAELMVDPERGLQCAIGDTDAVGAAACVGLLPSSASTSVDGRGSSSKISVAPRQKWLSGSAGKIALVFSARGPSNPT
jgi:hypothetical protein